MISRIEITPFRDHVYTTYSWEAIQFQVSLEPDGDVCRWRSPVFQRCPSDASTQVFCFPGRMVIGRYLRVRLIGRHREEHLGQGDFFHAVRSISVKGRVLRSLRYSPRVMLAGLETHRAYELSFIPRQLSLAMDPLNGAKIWRLLPGPEDSRFIKAVCVVSCNTVAVIASLFGRVQCMMLPTER